MAGNKLDAHNPWPVNPAGFTIHAAIHEHVPGAHCVMHTHTTNGLAVACTEGGRQVGGADEDAVHALDRGDGVEVPAGRARLRLHQQADLAVGLLGIAGVAAPACP